MARYLPTYSKLKIIEIEMFKEDDLPVTAYGWSWQIDKFTDSKGRVNYIYNGGRGNIANSIMFNQLFKCWFFYTYYVQNMADN